MFKVFDGGTGFLKVGYAGQVRLLFVRGRGLVESSISMLMLMTWNGRASSAVSIGR